MNKYWRRYEKGIDYLTRKQLVNRTDRNWNFYAGNQWVGIETGGEELPYLNFIKPTIKHKVSTVSQNNMVAKYSDAEGRDELQPLYSKLNSLFSADWEKANMDMELWELMKDSAVTGDGIHFFPDGDYRNIQRLTCTSILYGDENEPNIQDQPYIIIHQRLSVDRVRKEALENGLSPEEIELIVPDEEKENIVGNRAEVDGDQTNSSNKVTCIVHFEKKDGIVHICKTTKNVIYEPEHPIEAVRGDGLKTIGLRLYPILKISWEDFPNQARGISEVEQLLPNQLEINKTLARISITNKQGAYPRLVYDPDAIQNPDALDVVGGKIEASGGGVQSVSQMISYLNPAPMTSEPRQYAELLMSYSQELSGSGETAMGNIDPNRVAASAIIAIRDQAAMPLNEQVAKMKTYIEEFARLLIEMHSVFSGGGLNVLVDVVDPLTGQVYTENQFISTEELISIEPEIRVDTSQDSPWTKEAEQNWLDNIFNLGHISFEEYVEASPNDGIVPKNKMLEILAKRQKMMSDDNIATSAQEQWESQDNGSMPE